MKKKNKINWFNIIVFVIFLIVSLIVMLNHEAWRDEAQSFLVAKYTSLSELFGLLKYEGHPCLWYLILKIFIKIGFDYNMIKIIPWLLSLIVVAVFLIKAPFDKITKVIVVFGPVFLYIPSAFARNYSLAIFFMILLSCIYKNRDKHYIVYGLLLFLIANTHILMVGFVCILMLLDLYDIIKEKSKHKLFSFLIAFSGLIFLVLQLLGNRLRGFSNMVISFAKIKIFINHLFIFLEDYTITNFIALCLFVLLCELVIYLFKRREYRFLVILFCGLGFQLFVYTFIYGYSYYMGVLLIIIILFVVWQIYDREKNFKIFRYLVMLMFLFFLSGLIPRLLFDIKNPYSDSKNTALFIKKNINVNEKLYCVALPHCLSIMGYLDDYKLYDVKTDKIIKYMNWDDERQFELFLNNDDIENIKNLNVKYFIAIDLNDYLKNELLDGKAKIIYHSKFENNINYENFWIIEFLNE